MNPTEALKRAIDLLGGTVAAAKKLNLNSYQALQQWGANGVPAKHRAALEHATGGAVTVEDFGNDAVWHRIKDKAWPHPNGRPLLDVAAEAA